MESESYELLACSQLKERSPLIGNLSKIRDYIDEEMHVILD